MSEVLEKISSYNIFNYLFPGAVFAAIATKATQFSFVHENVLISIFVYYFIGLVISRVGSLVFEPVLKKWNFVEFKPYCEYVAACENDKKIEVLLETANMYRTLLALFFMLLLCILVAYIDRAFPDVSGPLRLASLVALLFLFLFSYRKQSKFVAERIGAAGK